MRGAGRPSSSLADSQVAGPGRALGPRQPRTLTPLAPLAERPCPQGHSCPLGKLDRQAQLPTLTSSLGLCPLWKTSLDSWQPELRQFDGWGWDSKEFFLLGLDSPLL